MPRPKVLPSQRRRAAEACNFCRASKKKCSATVPCTACQRRGIGASCYLTHRPRGLRKTPDRTLSPIPIPEPTLSSPRGGGGDDADADPSARQRPAPPEESAWSRNVFAPIPLPGWSLAAGPTSVGGDVDGEYQPISPSDSRISAPEAVGNRVSAPSRSRSPAIRRESHARMLLNLRGERVYIGGAASISFLQFIRDTVTTQLGPSQFSHNDKSDSMLETEPAVSNSTVEESSDCNVDLESSLGYMCVFQAATAGFLDIFAPTEIEDLLIKARTENARAINPCQKAAIDLVVAIGAQCKSPIDSQQVGHMYFRQAQRNAFVGMLEDPNIDMVKAFLLMAFYMLGHCRRNTAFMYLGIAARTAVALGLHSRDSYADMKSLPYQTRLRIWMSLCILDMLVCSILGRPPATAGLRAELDNSLITLPEGLETQQNQNAASLFASYKILTIVNESVDAFYGKKVASAALVEQFLSKIEEWSQELPSFLRGTPTSNTISSCQRTTMCSIHVSCLYYFSITLVTRPVLISTLTSHSGIATPSSSPLASACLDAAVYLVQTCADAHKAGILLGNMCIMKALVFAAGLILGFDMFAKRELDYEIETTFRSAKDVLDFLSIQSPQAAHYSEILSLLSNAIIQQRSRLSARPRSRYVGRIFSLDRERDSAQNNKVGDGEISQASQAAHADFTAADTGGTWLITDSASQATEMEGDMLRGWDTLDLSQWDSFPFYNPRVFGPE